MKNLFYIFLTFATLSLITSCDKDDDPVVVMGCMDSTALNYNANATEADPNDPCQYPPSVGCMDTDADNFDSNAEVACDDCCEYTSVMPESYVFMRDGLSTVAYDGQICRVQQAAQLMNNEFTNPANNAGALNDMIQNGFSISVCTDQKIGNKIAASNLPGEEVGNIVFQGWMTDIVNDLATNVFPTWDSPASVGVAGVIGGRHVNAHGLEPNQAFTKGLIGAMCLDQITNKYTQPAYISTQDNTPAMGGGYTTMEHKWDEGFGYLFGMDVTANLDNWNSAAGAQGDVLLLKYAHKIGADVVEDLYELFIEGRYAIVIGDYDARDAAALEIKSILDGIVMQKSVDYLRGGAAGIAAGPSTDDAWADIFHDLSEGYGFVLSLQFTDAFTHDDVVSMKATLDNDGGNGFWDIDPAALTQMADMIEAAM